MTRGVQQYVLVLSVSHIGLKEHHGSCMDVVL